MVDKESGWPKPESYTLILTDTKIKIYYTTSTCYFTHLRQTSYQLALK